MCRVCIHEMQVWTPIPFLTWIFPFVGHMGIATSAGVIRDFAGSYYVSEDEMAFGWPTRYLQLDLRKVTAMSDNVASESAATVWDRAVFEASDTYKRRVHNLICDNCHSHCALALERMRYDDAVNWNMIRLAAWMLIAGRHVDAMSVVKTWLPFVLMIVTIVLVCVFTAL